MGEEGHDLIDVHLHGERLAQSLGFSAGDPRVRSHTSHTELTNRVNFKHTLSTRSAQLVSAAGVEIKLQEKRAGELKSNEPVSSIVNRGARTNKTSLRSRAGEPRQGRLWAHASLSSLAAARHRREAREFSVRAARRPIPI